MKFLILACLVLSALAKPEPQHETVGFTKHLNGAVVPVDTTSVLQQKALHGAAHATAAVNGFKFPFYTYGLHHPVTYGPYYPTYGVHHLGKREAEAEAEADPSVLYSNYYGTPAGYPLTYGYPYYTLLGNIFGNTYEETRFQAPRVEPAQDRNAPKRPQTANTYRVAHRNGPQNAQNQMPN